MLESATTERTAALDVQAEQGLPAALDTLSDGGGTFLRRAWYGANASPADVATIVGWRPQGGPVAALPLVLRRFGPIRLREVPGSYWPFRSAALAADASDAETEALLAHEKARGVLGRAWRLGPAYADDYAAAQIVRAARRTGWWVIERSLGTAYCVDLKRLTSEGQWPSSKTLRKNRWCERRLAEMGQLTFRTVSGKAWDESILDTLALIERESWVGAKAGSADAKFIDPASRRMWRNALEDDAIAGALHCALLYVGGRPAAFTFAIHVGSTRYYIANSYSRHFADRSPGRVLLYRDFQQAVDAGIETIGWGAGDPGYKSEMGAQPGPQIVDYLFVRGAILAALLWPLWMRRGV